MLGARWDEKTCQWLFDLDRVRQLFVHKAEWVSNPVANSFGTLGQVSFPQQQVSRRAAPAKHERGPAAPMRRGVTRAA
jgi:hypothetical protein